MAKKYKNEQTELQQDAANFASNPEQFRINRVKKLKELYSDEPSLKRRFDQTATYKSGTYTTAKSIREALDKALSNRLSVVETSKKLYAVNPIYASVIDYISNMYMWCYYNNSIQSIKR